MDKVLVTIGTREYYYAKFHEMLFLGLAKLQIGIGK
jgi:hypothetical protein